MSMSIDYEKAKAQGLILRLPVPLGTTVYTVDINTSGDYEVFDWNVYGVCEDGLILTSEFSEIHMDINEFEKRVFLIEEKAMEKKHLMEKEEKEREKMKIKELAKYCKSIEINCDICDHTSECERFTEKLEDISPYGAIELIEDNEDL